MSNFDFIEANKPNTQTVSNEAEFKQMVLNTKSIAPDELVAEDFDVFVIYIFEGEPIAWLDLEVGVGFIA